MTSSIDQTNILNIQHLKFNLFATSSQGGLQDYDCGGCPLYDRSEAQHRGMSHSRVAGLETPTTWLEQP
jgi:hypothetical protein